MVASVHDTCAGDKSSAERRNHYDKSAPNFSLCIEDVQFGGEVEREIEQASERDCGLLVVAMQLLARRHTAAMSRRKALEPVLQDVVIRLRANGNGLQYMCALLYFGFVDETSAQSQRAHVRAEEQRTG
jgi:hypothetical protein